MDSTEVPALLVRAWWAVSLGDTADQRIQLQRLRRLAGDRPVGIHRIRALEALLATEEEFQEILRSPPSTSPELVSMALYFRAADLSRYERVLEAVQGGGDPTLARAAEGEAIRLHVARGHLDEVDAALRDGSLAAGGLDWVAQASLVAADLAGVGEREMARRAVEAMVSSLPPDSALAFFQTCPVWLQGWLMGAWSAQYGDTLLARRWIDAIGTFPPGGTSEDYRGSLQADIAGRLATRRGDLQEALDRARSAFFLWTIHTDNEYEYAAEPGMRFELALRYRDSGMADSARAVFSSFLPPTSWMGFLTARASFELGELAFAAGRMEEARAHYSTALRYWDRDGAATASFRRRAIARLEELGPP
jgi:tetratricopeptide (TPR) repeat protein